MPIKKSLVVIIFLAGIILFTLASFGFFDNISKAIASFLFNNLGYTNKWSRTYGPSWFVNMNGNVSALGSKELVFIFSLICFFYLMIIKRETDALKFAFTIIMSLIFIVLIKFINSGREVVTIKELYTESLANYPSGHTFISTVLYPSIAYYLSVSTNSVKLKSFYLIVTIFIVTIVGVSRITGGGHTVTEVIAGWSLGLSWFILIKFILFRNRKI